MRHFFTDRPTGKGPDDGNSRLRSFLGFGGRESEGLIDASRLTPIGKGGASLICKAHDERLGKDVVLKIAFDDGGAISLRDENSVLRKLAHPNVVKYLGCGMLRGGELDGYGYLELEYLEGQTLRTRLDTEKKISWEETRLIALGICDALQAVHDNRFIHRDVKPANIFLSTDGPKLIDFGNAKSWGIRSLISPSCVIPSCYEQGDLSYNAPEALLWMHRPESDQYALGAIMYEALAGRPAFTDKGYFEFLHGAISGPAPLGRFDPVEICDAVGEVIMRALSKDPKSRFASMAEMKAAIQEISG